MKTIIRAAVLALVVTGVAASTKISSASTTKTAVLTKTSAMPVPCCAPNDPNACGMGQ